MNVLPQAREVLMREAQAFEEDRLRYQPGLKPFVEEHGLAPVVAKAWELMAPLGETHFGRPRGYPFFHGTRVASSALWLAETEELREVDRVALFVAALFHDVSHADRDDDHQATGAQLVGEALSDLLPADRLALVCQLIRHSDDPASSFGRVESRILYDANTLDLQGAVYWWRAAAFAGAQAVAPEQALIALGETMETHREWIDKVHFDATRKALAGKAKAEDAILKALAQELGMLSFLARDRD